jgi:hypothetical protein
LLEFLRICKPNVKSFFPAIDVVLERHLTPALRAETNASASRRTKTPALCAEHKRRRFAPNQNSGASRRTKTPALRAEYKLQKSACFKVQRH